MSKSIANKRKVTSYPDPKYHRLLLASPKVIGGSISSHVNNAIKLYFDNMPAQELEKLKKRSKFL